MALDIRAKRVVVKNSRVRYDGGGRNGSGVIKIQNGRDATIDHVELNGSNHTHACVWHQRHGHGQPLPELLRHQRRHLQLVRRRLLADDGRPVHDRSLVLPRLHDQRGEWSRGRLSDRGRESRDDPSQHLSDDDRREQRDRDLERHQELRRHHGRQQPHHRWRVRGVRGGLQPVRDVAGGRLHADQHPVHEQQVQSTRRRVAWGTGASGSTAPTWAPYFGGPTDGWRRSGNVVLETGENIDAGNPHVNGVLCS